MNYITSNQNPVIKEIKALKTKKGRDEKNLYFVEGIKVIEESLTEPVEVVRLLASEDFADSPMGKGLLEKAQKSGIQVLLVTNNLYKEVSDTETPQGVMAVIKSNPASLEDMIAGNKFLVLLDSIQDPGNMGTIIRTADGADAGGIILSKGCVDPYNPKVLRSTMGSVFRVPIYSSSNLAGTVGKLKSAGYILCAAHLKGTVNYFELDKNPKTAFIIGNEANGLSGETASLADVLVKIPMPGRAESLNASVAAGLLMYEAVRWKLK